MELVPLQKKHLGGFKPRESRYLSKQIIDVMKHMAELKGGVSYCATKNAIPISVGGVYQTPVYGVGVVWSAFHYDRPYTKSEILFVYKAAKGVMSEAFADMKLHRIQTTVVVKDSRSLRWCKILGFEEEGVLRKYDDKKQDHMMLSIVR